MRIHELPAYSRGWEGTTAATVDGHRHPVSRPRYRASAIVSTYNSERHFRGCLENLFSQTLFAQGGLEIIVVDSGSPQNEGEIALEYQGRSEHVVYVRTQRETIYSAWNRAAALSRALYLVNANTDDRQRPDAFELMASELDKRDVGLVFTDALLTRGENETFQHNSADRIWMLPEFSLRQNLMDCCFGCQVMWRRSLHDEFGPFRESLKIAGDYEFFLKCSAKKGAYHIPECLALYHESRDNLSYADQGRVNYEIASFLGDFRRTVPLEEVYPFLRHTDDKWTWHCACLDFAGHLLDPRMRPDKDCAERYLRKALELCPESAAAANNLAIILVDKGHTEQSESLFQKYAQRHEAIARNLAELRARGKGGSYQLIDEAHPELNRMPAIKHVGDIRVPLSQYRGLAAAR